MGVSNQQEQQWKEEFVTYSFRLLNSEPKTNAEAILDFVDLENHLKKPIATGKGFIFEDKSDYIGYITVMHDRIEELNRIIDDTSI